MFLEQQISNVLQPIWSINGRDVLYHEMLARPKHVHPQNIQNYFDGLERTGHIKQFNILEITRAIALLDQFNGKLTVNLSPQTVGDPKAFKLYLAALEKAPFQKRARLMIEFTERQPKNYDFNVARDGINRISNLGFKVALDDFMLPTDWRDDLARLPAVTHIKLDEDSWRRQTKRHSGRISLRGWVETQQQVGKKAIIFEGVRNNRDQEMVEEMGGDGLQSLIFSWNVSPEMAVTSYHASPKPGNAPELSS